MKKILTILGILSILGGVNKVEAQLIPQFSQYMFNGLYINPAYAGYKDVFYGHVMYRKQWVGMESSPTTALVGIDGALKGGSNVGLVYANDKVGAATTNSIMFNYAFRFNVSEGGRLSFGLGAGMIHHGINRSKLIIEPDGTISPLAQNAKAIWKPSFDAGVYFDTKHFYAGFSLVGLLKGKRDTDNLFQVLRTNPNYFLTVGGMLPLNNSLKLMPSTLLSSDFENPLNIDLNLLLMIADRFAIGGSYRTGAMLFSDAENSLTDKLKLRDAVALIAEVYLSDRIRLGFAYDFDLNKLTTGHNGSFEVSLGYYLTKSKSKHVTPRYF